MRLLIRNSPRYTILLTGPTTVANLFYNMATRQDGAGRHLGRHRLRRGGRPPEDAQGGRDDAQDLLRVGHVRPWQGLPVGHGLASPCSATRTSRSR